MVEVESGWEDQWVIWLKAQQAGESPSEANEVLEADV